MNKERKNWKIVYVDMYDDSIHEELALSTTADEAIELGEKKWPHDRAIEDFHIEPLN